MRSEGNKINWFPDGPGLRVICYIAQQRLRRTAVVGQHSREQSTVLPSDVMDFALLPAQRLLAGNSFSVRCHVTSK